VGLVLALLLSTVKGAQYRPVVMMHGIAGDAGDMVLVPQWIQEVLPGTYVKNLEIGDGYWDSMFMPLNDQVQSMCTQLKEDENLAQGFNLIGYSQGGLITRGYIERCNDPPVHNFISWSGPHQGEFGIPQEPDLQWMVELVADGPYYSWIQDEFTFAQFWKDPFQYDEYLKYSTYLADINNERPVKNQTYVDNIKSLNLMVLLISSVDTIIIPKESSWFEFYDMNSDSVVIPLNQSQFYQEDFIGIRYLDEQKRLKFHTDSCPHPDYPDEDCKKFFTLYTLPYLNNTLP